MGYSTSANAASQNYVPNLYHDGFGHWLAGFVDGEGCFIIARSITGTVSYLARLSVALRVDDLAALEMIRDRLGMGKVAVYNSPSIAAVGKPPRAMWDIWRKADCLRLVEIFDHFPLRAKKARDYTIWREAVMELHSPTRSWERMAQLKEQLQAQRAFDGELTELPDPTTTQLSMEAA